MMRGLYNRNNLKQITMIKITTVERVYQPNNTKVVDIWDVLNAIKTGCYNVKWPMCSTDISGVNI